VVYKVAKGSSTTRNNDFAYRQLRISDIMASLWRQLPAFQAGAAEVPPLLISTFFQIDCYTVYLTDLIHIWSESLSRRAIFARSHEVNTSIDPTESDQLQIFMDKLKQGVDGGRNTAAAISISSDTGRPKMTLKITVDLPGGLPPLEWPFRLTPAPQSLLTAQLTIPLLQAQHKRMEEIAALAELLKEKDQVIQKMLDKFEGQGLHLGQVFPQAIVKGGRSLGRKAAEEKVKGLQVFDIENFKENSESEELIDAAQLVQRVFSSESQKNPRTKIKPSAPEEDDWWDDFKDQTLSVLSKGKFAASSSGGKSKSKPISAPIRCESASEEDDFQVQATPPISHDYKRNVTKQADDSTDEEDDLDAAPSQRSKNGKNQDSFQARVPSPKKYTKTGMIGGKKATQTFPAKEPNSSDDGHIFPSRGKKRDTAGEEKIRNISSAYANTTDDENYPPSPRRRRLDSADSKQSQSNPVADVETTDDEPSTTQIKSLGSIGGKNVHKVLSEDEDAKQDKFPSKSKQLGIIGGKNVALPSGDSSSDDDSLQPGPPKGKVKLGTLGGKKFDPPPSSSDDEPALKPSRGKGKLGTLGGKKRQVTLSPSTVKDSLDPENSSSDLAPHLKKKLATIGSKGKSVTADKSKEESLVRKQSVKKEETPLPEETAEEKADKKRQQLKRALEEKSKAPIKKKKKF